MLFLKRKANKIKIKEDCISLKLDVPQGCGGEEPQLLWFKEICNIKLEIEQKREKAKKNPKEEENKIKEGLKYILNEINDYFKKGKFEFLFYILKNQPPIGIDESLIFTTREQLENAFYQVPKKFMKKLRKLYNPMRYKGDKEEEQKTHAIMQEIHKLLNEFD